jgi:outer membrane lipoprotein-sorting protein
MKSNSFRKFIFIFLSLATVFSIMADEKGDEIARKNDGLKKSNDMYSESTMILIDKNGNRKTRKFVMYTKEAPNGRNSFSEFVEPADVKGTRFLSIGNKKDEDEQRLYLPALKKTRLIASNSKDGKFMGSDLTYYDMEERQFSDFTYAYIKDEQYQGKDCSVIEMKPVKTNSPYSRSVVWISKADNFAYRMDIYDKKDGELMKTIVFVEVKNIDGVLVPVKTAVDNKKEGTKTLIQMDNVKINKGIPDKIFSVQNLEG